MPRPARSAGEFELIAAFTALLPTRGEGVRLGPGDDAALLQPPRGETLVATVDAVVEGVHFDQRFTPADIGWKALAVNLSDLAAMGARPLWALVALGVPLGAPAARLRGIARGLGACARRHRLAVVGGNVTRALELSLTVTVVGTVARGRALRRDGARPGDLVLVSGTLGDAALGVAPEAAASLHRRQRRPTPRLALGLGLRRLATAAIDISDGLAQDLGHLCSASGVGATLRVTAAPQVGGGASGLRGTARSVGAGALRRRGLRAVRHRAPRPARRGHAGGRPGPACRSPSSARSGAGVGSACSGRTGARGRSAPATTTWPDPPRGFDFPPDPHRIAATHAARTPPCRSPR